MPIGADGLDYEIEEDEDDVPSNPSAAPCIGELVERRLSRRGLLGGMVAATAGAAVPLSWIDPALADEDGPSSLTFTEVDGAPVADHGVSPDYTAEILIRYGDPVLPGAPAFAPGKQTAAEQAKQFGYNNDFVAFMPLPRGSESSEHGLLCVNHEYTSPSLMWPAGHPHKLSPEQLAVEQAAHGHSVVEIKRGEKGWGVVAGSRYARRITATTAMIVSGPARGDARLKTEADPTGTRVIGSFNNCAGGTTPWGTVLMAEENFNKYFARGDGELSERDAASFKRYGLPSHVWNWAAIDPRFDVSQHPNEAYRHGWVVEFDPYDPASVPVKRTALGRFKHEGATCVVAHDGRVVVYMGDDEKGDYVYKFVSAGRFDHAQREANRDLLDEGTLYVARFADDGALSWLPLTWGEGPLTAANGFASQADVVIDCRQAADALEATPMDRPEDVEPDPRSGRVYVMLTNNSRRKPAEVNAANPRARNVWGHIIEMLPPRLADGAADHTATRYRWEMLLRCGDPAVKTDQARYHPAVSKGGWLVCPDNAAIDQRGRLWISTDRGASRGAKLGQADGLWGTDTEGEGRALTRMFYRCPRGAELCGPCFTPDCRTLFLAVQHPGEESGSTFEKPSTRWPDFKDGIPPRPSIVVVTKDDGGEIGG